MKGKNKEILSPYEVGRALLEYLVIHRNRKDLEGQDVACSIEHRQDCSIITIKIDEKKTH